MQESTRESTKNIMLKLKEFTKPLHDATEQHEFQKLLGTGSLSRKNYGTYLEQLYLIHSKLATGLEDCMNNKSIKNVVAARHLDTKAIESDLKYLKIDPGAAKPLTATETLLNTIANEKESTPEALLGILYVLEGSTHGAKYMASTLRKGLELEERNGSSYFDRYLENQMPFWLEFKKAMNEENFTESIQTKIIELAKSTFKAFSDIGTEIIAH